MRRIALRELPDASAAIMHAVKSGETVRITRHGVDVAELRPVVPSPYVRTADVVARVRHLPPFDLEKMRREEDELFGSRGSG